MGSLWPRRTTFTVPRYWLTPDEFIRWVNTGGRPHVSAMTGGWYKPIVRVPAGRAAA